MYSLPSTSAANKLVKAYVSCHFCTFDKAGCFRRTQSPVSAVFVVLFKGDGCVWNNGFA